MSAKESTQLREFEKAVQSFETALSAPKTDLNRDATIQRFEFCVELAWKTAKKILKLSSSSPKTVIRELAQEEMITDPKIWLEYIDLRNLTVHTYREEVAEEVYQKCKNFLGIVKALLEELKKA